MDASQKKTGEKKRRKDNFVNSVYLPIKIYVVEKTKKFCHLTNFQQKGQTSYIS